MSGKGVLQNIKHLGTKRGYPNHWNCRSSYCNLDPFVLPWFDFDVPFHSDFEGVDPLSHWSFQWFPMWWIHGEGMILTC